MNEIHSFMSENGPRNRFHMLTIWKTYLAAGRPSWIEISKRGYIHLHQWATIDNVYAWPCPGHIIKEIHRFMSEIWPWKEIVK